MNQIITFDVTYLCKRKNCIIYNSKQLYFSVSYKDINFFKFSYIFYFSLLRGRGPYPEVWWATFGHRLGNPVLEYSPINSFSNLKQYYLAVLGLGALLSSPT